MPRKRIISIFCVSAALLLVSLPFLFCSMPDIESGFDYAVTVHSDDGVPIAEFYKERRFYVPYPDIPDHVKKAFVATEDQRFYSHYGFDIKGIARALRRNIGAKSVVEGGSTITQQLAKIILREPKRSLSRKLREMILAFKLEWKYSKEEILGIYLNLAYFGEKAYGIEAAARTYFNKSATSLNVAEAALLAGLQRAPSRYSPLRNPQRAKERMTSVLKQMLALKYISSGEYEAALLTPLPQAAFFQRKHDAPYFTDIIRQRLKEKYGDTLYKQGLHVFSTYDQAMQSLAERSVREGVRKIELRTRSGVQAALVAVDLASGEIKAMVGGTDFDTSQFNRATMALRQPGSAFKAFVYAAALQTGMSYDDYILDEQVSIQDSDGGFLWTPRNSGEEYYGDVSLKTAFALSLNSATVRLAQLIGFDRVREMAQRCGIRSNLHAHPSIALGSSEVTVLELTAAYAALATGRKVLPTAYSLITDKKGKNIEQQVFSYQEILPDSTVKKMRVLLRATVETGIAGKARAVNRPVYGKTGTTNDYADAWFVGFDDRLAVGVWVGRDDHTPIGIEETGSGAALPIWTEFMKKVRYRDSLRAGRRDMTQEKIVLSLNENLPVSKE